MGEPPERGTLTGGPGASREPVEWGFDEIVIRPSEYQVFVEGRRVPLTRREFEIFHCLARRLDRVVTRQEVYEEVWGGTMAHRDRSVDVFVRKVRQKLTSVAPDITFIHTHFGIGYRLAPERAVPFAGDFDGA